MAFLTHGMDGTQYETGGLDRRNSCGHVFFEDLAIIAHLVLAILSVLPDGVRSLRTAQRGVARARDLKAAKFSKTFIKSMS